MQFVASPGSRPMAQLWEQTPLEQLVSYRSHRWLKKRKTESSSYYKQLVVSFHVCSAYLFCSLMIHTEKKVSESHLLDAATPPRHVQCHRGTVCFGQQLCWLSCPPPNSGFGEVTYWQAPWMNDWLLRPHWTVDVFPQNIFILVQKFSPVLLFCLYKPGKTC